MKALTVILFVLVVRNCSSYLIKGPIAPLISVPKFTPAAAWINTQKLMQPLFENVCEQSTDTEVIRIAQKFTLDSTNGEYTKADVIENLRKLTTGKGLLPKSEIFSEYNTDHFYELKTIYELFYYAKDFTTFYTTACWARQNINCGVYVDAIYMAILTRRDTEKLVVAAPYELLPNYFIRKDVIIKASDILAGREITTFDDIHIENNAYVIDANYTNEFNSFEDTSKLAYFNEDIGLNSFYYLWKLKTIPWVNKPDDMNSHSGEYIFFMMKQLAARYDLERLSNKLPELEGISWEAPVIDYDPMLIYSNGKEFSHGMHSNDISYGEDLSFIITVEQNLASIVTHLRQAGHDKTQILNHLIDILVMADKNYEATARRLLTEDSKINERQFSSIEHYLTSVRDPSFWKINKKIVNLVDDALKILPTYRRSELYFPGVEILNVQVKKMMTSYESFKIDVTESLRSANSHQTFPVRIIQPRLDHKPFTMKFNISSLIYQKGIVKTYLGPKTYPGEIVSKKNLFFLLDQFELDLKRGNNVVSRSSNELKFFSGDFTSINTLRKKVEDSEFGLDALPLNDIKWQIGFPSRLMLPKGLANGLQLQLFVFIAPLYKTSIDDLSLGNMQYNTLISSPGYPFDLLTDEKQLFSLPNAFMKDIVITHKEENQPNYAGGKPKQWEDAETYEKTDIIDNDKDFEQEYDDDSYRYPKSHYLLNERPVFTYKNSDTTDYAAKRNQYKNKSYFSKEPTTENLNDFYKNDATKEHTQVYDETSKTDTFGSIHSFANGLDDLDYGHQPTHFLLRDRPAFTYKNRDTTNYAAKSNRYIHKFNNNVKTENENVKILKEKIEEGTDEPKHFIDNTREETTKKDSLSDHYKTHKLLGQRRYDSTFRKNDDFPIKTKKNIYNMDDLFDKDILREKSFIKVKDVMRTIPSISNNNHKYNENNLENNVHGLLSSRFIPYYKTQDSTENNIIKATIKHKSKKENYNTIIPEYFTDSTTKVNNIIKPSINSTLNKEKELLNSGAFDNSFFNKNSKRESHEKVVESETKRRIDIKNNNDNMYDSVVKEVVKISKPIENIEHIFIVTDDGIFPVQHIEEDHIIIEEPSVPEPVPKKRVTVYDYLFNSSIHDDKVYY